MDATAEARTTAAKAAAEQVPKISLSKQKSSSVASRASPARDGVKKPGPALRRETPVSLPVIKLKVPTALQPPPRTETPASTPSEKPEKPKQRPRKPAKDPTPEVPPPPYVDDGSHDILQEVLAIEREKEQRRRPSPRPDDRTPSTAKRKLQHADDDIFNTPGPSKREKRLAEVSSTVDSRPSTPTIKFKKPKDPDHVTRLTPDAVPKPTVKGKERENIAPPIPPIPPASSAPSRPKHSVVAQATPINEKKCQQVLKAVLASEHAVIFARPVDPILDGCPT
jgi:transcription initiation factor TFIID subunit 2